MQSFVVCARLSAGEAGGTHTRDTRERRARTHLEAAEAGAPWQGDVAHIRWT